MCVRGAFYNGRYAVIHDLIGDIDIYILANRNDTPENMSLSISQLKNYSTDELWSIIKVDSKNNTVAVQGSEHSKNKWQANPLALYY